MVDQVERASENPWYAWKASPPLSALVETVAQAAKAYEPNPVGLIANAIASRKNNSKAEYLRAFVYLTFEEHNGRAGTYDIVPTPAVKNAMAIAANVAFNQSNNDISPDDVRKALRNVKGRTMKG